MKTRILTLGALALAAAACTATTVSERPRVTNEQALAVLKASFNEKGQAKMDRLEQDEVQKTCSDHAAGSALPKDVAERIEKAELAKVKYPADGKLVGDWKNGEKIAQSGVGKQYSDDPKVVAGGNCYACHELT